MRSYSVDALGDILDKAGVPNAPLTADQVVRHPQTRTLDMTVRSSDDIELVGIPLAFDGARPRTRMAAPTRGRYNAILHPPASRGMINAK